MICFDQLVFSVTRTDQVYHQQGNLLKNDQSVTIYLIMFENHVVPGICKAVYVAWK